VFGTGDMPSWLMGTMAKSCVTSSVSLGAGK
jgi:hypothetical protein